MVKRVRYSVIWVVVLAAILLLCQVPAVLAAAPADVWSAPGMQKGFFSQDGTWVVLSGTASAGGRIEVRASATGALLRTLTNTFGFSAVALTQDKLVIAAASSEIASGKHGSTNLVRKIYLYRASDGALLRSISTDATRDIRSLDFSPDGLLLASMDELSYGSGGRVRVFRVSNGNLERKLDAGTQSTAVRFSPNGQFLAANDQHIFVNGIVGGVRVFRTSDWASVMTVGNGARLVQWSTDGATIWTKGNWDGTSGSSQRVSVPTGAVLSSVPTSDYTNIKDVTSDNRLFLADRAAAPQNVIRFVDASSGNFQVSYQFGTNAFAGDISPDGKLFTYSLSDASGGSTLIVAQMPAL